MRSLLDRHFKRSARTDDAEVDELEEWGDWVWPKSWSAKAWNTLSTLGVGAVADVDSAGMVALSDRPLAVDFWIGGGDRWWMPARESSVRQKRVAGLPIIETRMRVGDSDVVFTAWADEPGDARGRVVVAVETETDVPVTLAVVVRPFTIVGLGHIGELRVVGDLIVADHIPLVRLPGSPRDVFVGSPEVGDVHSRLPPSEESESRKIDSTQSTARTLAAMMPLTPGVEQVVEIVDGRELPTVAPAPLDRVVAGWRSHLAGAATLTLPGWPELLPVSLVSGLVGLVADGSRSAETNPVEDAAIAIALARVGLGWASAQVVQRLLDAVEAGRIRRSGWFEVAAACGRLAAMTGEVDVVRNHADTVVQLVGMALEGMSSLAQQSELVEVVEIVAGERAALDAAEIGYRAPKAQALQALASAGIDLCEEEWQTLANCIPAAPDRSSAASIGLRMAVAARSDMSYDGVVDTRALAGSTWRWPSRLGNGRASGDSPHARAALLNGLMAVAVCETTRGLDLVPGFASSWRGSPVDVTALRTRFGVLSFSLRWHGERPALLWELVDGPSGVSALLTIDRIDRTFASSEQSGEALLQAPSVSPAE